MKKKKLITLLSALCIATAGLALASCGTNTSKSEDSEIQKVYNQYLVYAQANEITPLSYEEWLATLKGENGKDGAGIKSVAFDENGLLVVTLTDGTVLDGIEIPKQEQTAESLQYQKIDGKEEYRVVGLGTVSDLDVVIPATYRGLPVTEIDDCAFYSHFYNDNYRTSYLKSIVIPDSVTSIGSYAFRSCGNLTSVTIGNSVTSIGDCAFENCSSLTSVTIPDSVTSIGRYAFSSCRNLTSITIPESVTSIEFAAFSSSFKLVEVINKSSHITVTKGSTDNGYIGYRAFDVYNADDTFKSKLFEDNGYIVYANGNEKILIGYTGVEKDLILPDHITQIYNYAFFDCNSLTSIIIPDGVTSIDSYAFANCSSLTSVTIPDSVTSIGGCAFEGCSNLTNITIPESVTSIDYGAFYDCSSLTSITIPNSVTSIEEDAFNGCNSLTNIYITDIAAWCKISGLGYLMNSQANKNLYLNNTLLTELVIPDGITSIYNYAFARCSNLTNIVIPDGVTVIGAYAFKGCGNLTSIIIPDSVTKINYHAFEGCGNLTIYCEATKEPNGWYDCNPSNCPVVWGYVAKND